MRFPIVLKDAKHADRREPPARLYYEVASNGTFQVKDTPLFRAVTRATRPIPGLEPSDERLWMKFPPLPLAIIEDVLAFFHEVNERWQGEAIAFFYYRPESREFRVDVPPQRIPGYRDLSGRLRAYLHLDYGSVRRPAGFLPFGTVHSHARCSAYSSGVDCDDERLRGDGLHVVYGRFGREPLSRSASFVVNGRRFRIDPERVLPDCPVPRRRARSDWMARVRFEETSWKDAYGWSADVSTPLIGLEKPREAAGDVDAP